LRASGAQVILERPRINNLLEKAVKSPLVTVVAGAGYGKTESVYAYLKSHAVPTTWFQLSTRDNMGSRFWENYANTIAKYDKRLAAILAELGFPVTDSEFDRYLTIVEENISLKTKYLFVFDDFHLIHDKSVLRFVERSVNTPFPNVTTIIISRSEPSINTISMLAKGLVAHIGEDDLVFDDAEMRHLFELQGVKPSSETMADIYKNTEGWAFAINLAGMSIKRKPSGEVQAITAMKANIFKLIEREVFSVVSEELRKFLVKLSLVEHLPLDLIKELVPDENLLDEALQASAFIRYDAYLNEYRMHHFFLDYLTGLQGILTEEEKKSVYQHAIQWCIDNNYKMDAMSYCEKAGDYQKLTEVFYTLQMMVPNDVGIFLLAIFKRIPKDEYAASNVLCLIYTRLLASLGMVDETILELLATIQRFDAMPQTSFTCRALYGLYNNLGFTHYFDYMYSHNKEFWRYFEKGSEYYPKSGHRVTGPITNLSVGAYACRVGGCESGEIDEFIAAVDASEPHVAATMNGCMHGLGALVRAEVAYYRADLKNCEKFAMQSFYQAREQKQYEIENRALFFLLRTALATGKHSMVQDYCRQLESSLDVKEYINRYTLYDIVMGWYWVTLDRGERVAGWLKNDFEKSDINMLMHGFENVVKVKVYLLEKRYHELMAFLDGQGERFGARSFLFGKLAQKILAAICHYRIGEHELSLSLLSEAYELSRPNSLNMLFIEYGNEMRNLTAAALKAEGCAIPKSWLEEINRKAAAYAKKVTAAIAADRKSNRPSADGTLTTREVTLLTDLYQGLSRKEIAANHGLSINTVKTALQVLYVKLGAKNLADALRIAGSMEILN
jgi:LuxR family maltose regulon positive regulatory protein